VAAVPAASNHRQLDVSPLSFEGSHGRHGAVEIVAPAFPANSAGFALSLYQDPISHPVGLELFQTVLEELQASVVKTVCGTFRWKVWWHGSRCRPAYTPFGYSHRRRGIHYLNRGDPTPTEEVVPGMHRLALDTS